MERFFKNPHTLLSKRESPLGLYIDEFAQQLCEQGYSRQYARRRLQLVAELSQWLRQQDLVVSDLTSMHLESYLEFRARSRRTRPGDAASLKVFLELLQQKNLVVAPVEFVEKTPIDKLQDEFSLYLQQERVLAPTTVIRYASFAKELLKHRFGIGPVNLSLLSAADVIDFVRRCASSLARKEAKLMTTAVRSFLQYARYRDFIRADLAACVPCVADWSSASIPKSLPLKHVKGVLASCNRKTAIGRRDYAILLLLARLGVRAGEVVFLRGHAPAFSFKSSQAVSTVVRHALARAGIKCPRKGAHQFRHTLATEMLRQGASLAEIGELLRHRHPQTTSIYAKVDLPSLRTLALPWPGGTR